MSLVQIHDKNFELFISKKELESIVDQMAKKWKACKVKLLFLSWY